jgi:hypothetical protein
MRFTKFSLVVLLATSACFVESAPPVLGTVIFDWTVNGTTDPYECRLADADAFSVSIYDDRDRFVGTFDAACEDFRTSILLDRGWYSADALLVDRAGHARTTTVSVVPFYITRGSLDVPLDFPARAFY